MDKLSPFEIKAYIPYAESLEKCAKTVKKRSLGLYPC